MASRSSTSSKVRCSSTRRPEAVSICQDGAPPADLYFSEYVEGSSNNKALEIYNAQPIPVDLGSCDVRFYFGGSPLPLTNIQLAGVVNPGSVFVLCDIDIALAAQPSCDLLTGHPYFNGDDAVALVCDGVVFDVIGEIGFDPWPETEWQGGLVGTANEPGVVDGPRRSRYRLRASLRARSGRDPQLDHPCRLR